MFSCCPCVFLFDCLLLLLFHDGFIICCDVGWTRDPNIVLLCCKIWFPLDQLQPWFQITALITHPRDFNRMVSWILCIRYMLKIIVPWGCLTAHFYPKEILSSRSRFVGFCVQHRTLMKFWKLWNPCCVTMFWHYVKSAVLSDLLGLVDSHVCPQNTANQHTGVLFPGQKASSHHLDLYDNRGLH